MVGADIAALVALGQRVQQRRIALSLTQQNFARQSGVSLATLQRFEAGHGIQMGGFCRIFSSLQLGDFTAALDRLLPATPVSPMALLKLGRAQRRRVRAGQNT
jgi:transcriptional regulator with XRE-family HTH domain